MNSLSWELDVLLKAVNYPNLSVAASLIGISQPQLSRIVKKLEETIGLTLLDRTSKRASAWTPIASKVADAYQKTLREFNIALTHLRKDTWRSHVRIGSLDGMAGEAMKLSRKILAHDSVTSIELDIYDLPDLEERFLNGKLDLIFSLREPGKSKSWRSRVLGYQSIEEHGANGGTAVRSQFEQIALRTPDHPGGGKPLPDKGKIFISNSMAIRETWIRNYSGRGTLPSPIKPRKSNKGLEYPALLIARADIPDFLWNQIIERPKTL